MEPSASATQTHVVCRATDAEEATFAQLMRTAPASFGAMFLNRVHDTPGAESYRRRLDDGTWASETWAQTGQIVSEIAAGLLELGLGRGNGHALMKRCQSRSNLGISDRQRNELGVLSSRCHDDDHYHG